ncbi:MAG: MarR family transcriptional regulator [Streptosporangiales bacterium]|nr:MarR family transcriptional regulator [Streptosporangiales bacterium]
MWERLERELMLVGRRQLHVRAATGERLEQSAYVLLRRLADEGPMTIRQLTEAFCLDTSTVNRQTGALLRCGYIERIPDDEGGLARKLRITAAGTRRVLADQRHYQQWVADELSGWSHDDVAALTGLLARFNGTVEAARGRPWPRPD